jgi:hypothetical protein
MLTLDTRTFTSVFTDNTSRTVEKLVFHNFCLLQKDSDPDPYNKNLNGSETLVKLIIYYSDS